MLLLCLFLDIVSEEGFGIHLLVVVGAFVLSECVDQELEFRLCLGFLILVD